jgi:osmotically-inducible protein OsmY
MDLTLAAIIIMGGWVILIVAAGLVMSLRPGGVAVRFAPAGRSVTDSTGDREEILLGGEADVLGNVRGRVEAVLVEPQNRRLLDLVLTPGPGLEARHVPASAVLSADGRVVRLAHGWEESPDGTGADAATLRRDMVVKSADGKRLGRLKLVCFDRATGVVTALVVDVRGEPSLRLLPIDRVREAGPNGIVTDLKRDDWTTLPSFATDWDIKQTFLDQLNADPVLRDVQRSMSIDGHDQAVTLRGYVADRSQAEQVVRLIKSVPGVMQVDSRLITDDDLTRAVTDAIRRDPATSDVRVSAHFGTVDITGTAPDRAAARRIEALASQVPGAQVVHNMVAVSSPTGPGAPTIS